jgi:hypothetical protein
MQFNVPQVTCKQLNTRSPAWSRLANSSTNLATAASGGSLVWLSPCAEVVVFPSPVAGLLS